MIVARLNLDQAAVNFRENRVWWKKHQVDDTQSQVVRLAKVIRKEVFDISDTMDVMAPVIRRQEEFMKK